ncbi:efflux RND transporter periplasmic adaptor subunit [Sphingobacterium sp. SYP-B4668]|uniref:efflux RND transporter periplasmic adaptor subunit n=1 Tax=Sphingobacterium sp. SYP-B4668 TaxID=2996035 RepID=UPI0022DD1412|nr:efflux RND transporter periplasmic adaptor subunit [Sphingobacterium sp. SYP-B4668]
MKSLIYILLASTLTFAACFDTKKEDKADTSDKSMPMMMPLETMPIHRSNPLVKLKLAGELAPDQETELYAKVSSYVKKIHVDIGDRVGLGQVLMVLEAPEIQSQLATAKEKWKAQEAIYIATKANYDRMFKANETQGAVAKDALDQITARKLSDEALLNAAKAAYAEIQDMDNYLIIRAPFAGTITDRNVDLGAYVSPMGKAGEKPLLVVQNTQKLRLSLAIPEANTHFLHVGDTIHFRVRSLPQNKYSAKISRKSGTLDLKLRAEKIEADFINTGDELKPFMVAEAEIPLQHREPTFFIPKTALVESNLGVYVIKDDNGKAMKIPLSKGRVMADKFEVFGELNEGDRIVVKASEEIQEGTTIPAPKK